MDVEILRKQKRSVPTFGNAATLEVQSRGTAAAPASKNFYKTLSNAGQAL
jgi:hypothetical protein